MTVVERDGPCSIERFGGFGQRRYVFTCHECNTQAVPTCRRDAEDLYDQHTQEEA